MIKVNDKEVRGPAGILVGCATAIFIVLIFLFIAFLFLSPIIIPILIGFLIGKVI